MNRKIAVIAAAAVLSCTFGMTGCSDFSMGTDSLLRPPRATGDKAEIQNIIDKEAGGNYVFKYPRTGENRSAVTMRNEDTENEYALALYSTENDTKLNVSIIALKDNEWTCLGTFSNNCSGVDRIVFEDICGDKNEEILIGWTNYNSSRKSLTGYSITTEGAFEMTVDEQYDEIIIADITEDYSKDIFLLTLSTEELPATAVALQYSEKDKRPIAKYSMEMDPEVRSFANIMVGDVAVDTKLDGGSRKVTANSKPEESSRQESKNSEPSDAGETSKGNKQESSDQNSKNDKQEPSDQNSKNDKQESSDQNSKNDKQESGAQNLTNEKTDVSVQSSGSQVSSKNSRDSEDQDEDEDEGTSEETSEEEESVTEVEQDSEEEEASEQSAIVVENSDGDEITELSKSGIVLDCTRKDGSYCTQMVYYDRMRNELTDPIISETGENSYNANPTIRADAVLSRDLNGDSVIEIPIITGMMASVKESGTNVCNLTAWSCYDAKEEKLVTVYNTVMNSKDGYYFIMPERWNSKVTARNDPETREMTFYLWNSKTSSLGDKLLTIYRLTEQQWNEKTDNNLFRIEFPDAGINAVYAARIYATGADDDLNTTSQEIQKSVLPL